MQRKLGRFLLVALLFSATACNRPDSDIDATVLDTDLGPSGNKLVVKTFHQYRNANSHCPRRGAKKNIPRVLLTGFGPFNGGEVNISGVIAHALTRPNFWPDHVYLDETEPTPSTTLEPPPQTNHGGWSAIRTLWVDGKEFEVCSIYLDVQWDLAAAIILEESSRFKPDFLMMTGLGTDAAVFEGVVQNKTDGLSGFDGKGNASGDKNLPVSNYVLPERDPGVSETIPLNWDNRGLADIFRPIIQKISPDAEVIALETPDPNNNYICNNVSYVAAVASRGFPVRLAGGRIKLRLRREIKQVGFLHYPRGIANDARTEFYWAKAVVASISHALFDFDGRPRPSLDTRQ